MEYFFSPLFSTLWHRETCMRPKLILHPLISTPVNHNLKWPLHTVSVKQRVRVDALEKFSCHGFSIGFKV